MLRMKVSNINLFSWSPLAIVQWHCSTILYNKYQSESTVLECRIQLKYDLLPTCLLITRSRHKDNKIMNIEHLIYSKSKEVIQINGSLYAMQKK